MQDQMDNFSTDGYNKKESSENAKGKITTVTEMKKIFFSGLIHRLM